MADYKSIAFFNVEKFVYPKTGKCKLQIAPSDGLSSWNSKSQTWEQLELEENDLYDVQPSDTEIRLRREKEQYDGYETRIYVKHSLQYEQGRLVGAKHAQDNFCYGGLTLVDSEFISKDSNGEQRKFTPYFAKNEYIGALADGNGGYNMLCAEDGTTGLYASPAIYEALSVHTWEVRRLTDIDSLFRKGSKKDTSPRESVLVFWKDQNTKLQEITIRSNTAYCQDYDKNPTKVFPSEINDSDSIPISGQMTIRYCSNYAYELDDNCLSSIAGKSLRQYEVKGWYYVVNGVKTIISNMLDYRFVWQAALTNEHRKESNPKCIYQHLHKAYYNLYPYIEDDGAKTLSVTFYDYDGVELSDYSQVCQYGTAAILPTAMKAKPVGNSVFPHTGWIDHTNGRQANLVDVTHDIKCIPEYVDPLADVDGIISIDDLKRYVVNVISLQCDNVGYGECYISHEYYIPSYSRQYGDVIRSISPDSCQYVQCVFLETLEQDVDDYMKNVDAVLREYRGKYANTGLVLLYYLAMVYFIKSTVRYVHGYKHESLGSYNASHMMYVPGMSPDFYEYVMRFDLIDDLVSIMMDVDDSYCIQYQYRHKDAKAQTVSSPASTISQTASSVSLTETIASDDNALEITDTVIDQTLEAMQKSTKLNSNASSSNIKNLISELGSVEAMRTWFLNGSCSSGILIMRAFYAGYLTKDEAKAAFASNKTAYQYLMGCCICRKALA